MSTEQLDRHALACGRAFPWHEVYVPDVEAATKFYTEALGFGTREDTMANGQPYRMLTSDGTPVAGVFSTNAPEMQGVPAHWAVYVAVDDLEGRLEKCLALGASVVVPPMDIPNVGRIVLIADPQGAHLWLYKSVSG